MQFSRQEYWRGLPFPSPGYLPNPGTEPKSPALAGDLVTTEPRGKPSGRQSWRLITAGLVQEFRLSTKPVRRPLWWEGRMPRWLAPTVEEDIAAGTDDNPDCLLGLLTAPCRQEWRPRLLVCLGWQVAGQFSCSLAGVEYYCLKVFFLVGLLLPG